MSQKSKKTLYFIILIVCIILITFALFLKNREHDNSELDNINSNLQSNSSKNKIEKDLSFLDDDFIDTRVDDSNQPQMTKAQKEEFRKGIAEKMNMSLMYKTPESVMKSVVFFQEKGDVEQVDKLIMFLVENFPDYDIPENF